MLYVNLEQNAETGEYICHGALFHSEFHKQTRPYGKMNTSGKLLERGWVSRWDWWDYGVVERIAAAVTKYVGELHIAVDRGQGVSPRLDIILAPKVGDEVSKSFNGDTYPMGTITKISPSMHVITTSTGAKFYRQGKNSGTWAKGSFYLIPGKVYEQNPHL